MPNVGISSPSTVTGYSGFSPIYVDGIGLPSGRASASGNTSCGIYALYGYLNGKGGARVVNLQLGSAGTGNFTASSGSNGGGGYGYYGTGLWIVNGGSARFQINIASGEVYFGRGGGGTTHDGNGASFAGTLAGAFSYCQAPSAPQSPVGSVVGQTVGISWAAPADITELGLTRYRVQVVDNTASTTTTVDVASTATSYSFTGTPGHSYTLSVGAGNPVTDANSDIGVYSGTVAATVPSGGKVWDAPSSTFKAGTANVYDLASTSWKVATVKVWDAGSSSWKIAK